MFFTILTVIISLLIVLIIGFFKLSDCSLNLWLAHQFGLSEESYFRGKTVWVIGCSSDIGSALVRRLAAYNCKLILSARRVQLLEELKSSCLDFVPSSQVTVVPLDVVNFESLPSKVKEAKSAFGNIDVIMLNCGRSQRSDWVTVSPEVDEACFRVNALGPTVLAREYIKTLETDSKGVYPSTQIVVTSSVAGVIPAVCSPSYTAAKHALMGYFRLLSFEYGSIGLAVSIICPSLTFAPNNLENAYTDRPDKCHGGVVEMSPAHMTADRCAHHILTAAANHLSECWLSQTVDVLLLVYGYTYLPYITMRLVNFVGVDKIKKIRSGVED